MMNINTQTVSGIWAKVSVVVMLAVGGLLSGCIDNTTIVEVKKDGSGFVTEVTYVSPAMDQMMGQMMQGMMAGMTNGGADGGGKLEMKVSKASNEKLLDRKQYEAKAKTMGEGVRLVDVTEVKRKDGATGVRVDYAFTDISKIKVEAGSPKQGGGGPGMEQSGKPEKKGKPMTFAFTPGTPARLTIIMPPDEKSEKEAGSPSEESSEPAAAMSGETKGKSAESAQDKAMEAMMKNILKDFHLNLRIKVDGEIQKTNASLVQAGKTSHKKQYVTLYDIDFSKIIDDPKYVEKLAGLDMMGGSGSAAATKALLKGLPGMQFETEKRVEIEFQ